MRVPYFTSLAAMLSLAAIGPAAAAGLTAEQCGAKYQAAKSAGTLNGADWNSFRTTQCGPAPTLATAPVAAAAPSAPGTPTPAAAIAPPAQIPPTAAAKPAKPAVAATGTPVFPTAINPKYASLKAGTARRKTCDEQFKLNKATGGNAGLPWNQKGGGYYSACNKKLKGA